MSLPEQRCFLGFQIDSDFFHSFLMSVIELMERPMLNKSSTLLDRKKCDVGHEGNWLASCKKSRKRHWMNLWDFL